MRGHVAQGVVAAQFEETRVVGGVVLQQLGSELETLGPFGPAPRGVVAANGKNRRAAFRLPVAMQAEYFPGGPIEEAIEDRTEGSSAEFGFYSHRVTIPRTAPSFPRRRESSTLPARSTPDWIPAFEGMTVN